MKTLSTLKSTTLAIALAFGVTSITAMAFDTDEVKDGQAPLASSFLNSAANGA